MGSRYAHLERLLGAELLAKVRCTKLLVVGAGGIGCELLKDLVLTGFEDIEVIDLDTIDVSNLNRQFLFRPQHVGQPKAVIAREAVLGFNPAANIVAYHASIYEPRFGLPYFKKFALVINALDNIAARRHVNRLCLSAEVPLIEAGTQGYKGQSYVIQKKVTQCYECEPKATPKKFAICTIRSTPEKPVHAVVWAKELHKLLFGDKTQSYLFDAGDGEGPAAEGGAGKEGTEDGSGAGASSAAAPTRNSAYIDLVHQAPASGPEAASAPPVDSASLSSWAEALFDGLFHDDIAERLRVAPETFKTAKQPPKPLGLAAIRAGELGAETASTLSPSAGGIKDQRVLSLSESAELFLSSLAAFYKDATVRASLGSLEFSKDSPLDLDFVTAATNLRAYTFGIPMQSRWDVKSVAGNIIPAIATTNAIVAGLEVLEALKIVRGDDIKVTGRYTWVSNTPNASGMVLTASKLDAPSPDCFVCGTTGVTLFIDTQSADLETFISAVLKGRLSFNQPTIDNGGGFFFFDGREDDEDDDEYQQRQSWLSVPLAKLIGGGIQDGMTVEVDDNTQEMHVRVSIVHRAKADFDEVSHPQFFEVVGEAQAASTREKLDEEKRAAEAGEAAAAGADASGSGAGANSSAASAGKKRPREEASASAPLSADSNGVFNVDSDSDAEDEESDVKRARTEAIPTAGSKGGSDDCIDLT